MRRPTLFAFALLSAVSSLPACGEAGGDPATEIASDTLPGGTVVVENPALGLWGSEPAWRAVEEVRIGTMEGDGPEVFGQIRDVAVDAAGRLYVLESQAREVRVFDANGRYVRTVGGPGEGPAELMGPNGMTFDPQGRLWVSDPQNGRYSVFDTTGALVASHPRQVEGFGFYWEGGFDAQGRLVDVSLMPDGFWLLRFEPSNARLAVVDSFPIPREQIEGTALEVPGEGGARLFISVPFSPAFLWAFDGRESIWFGRADRYRLYERGLSGDTLRIVERRRAQERPSSEEVDAVIRRGGWDERLGAADLRELRAMVPETKPHFGAFFTDDAGYLWVGRSGDGTLFGGGGGLPSTFDLYDPEGRFLGELEVAVDVRPLPRVQGSRFVGVYRDELDVPHVVVHRLEGR